MTEQKSRGRLCGCVLRVLVIGLTRSREREGAGLW